MPEAEAGVTPSRSATALVPTGLSLRPCSWKIALV
jgi:hypothetical protein